MMGSRRLSLTQKEMSLEASEDGGRDSNALEKALQNRMAAKSNEYVYLQDDGANQASANFVGW